MTVPIVKPPNLGEQKLHFVEYLINSTMSQVANEDCNNSAQHATSFYPAAMMVGTKNFFLFKDLFKCDLLIEIYFFHINDI